jgi:rhodanese-related sulfurtransferase
MDQPVIEQREAKMGEQGVGQFVGNVSPEQAWQALALNPRAVLVDVRTMAEWAYVGGPDLTALQRSVVRIEWQHFPTGERNPDFADEVRARGIEPESPVYLICRSGVRSRAAAELLAELGYTTHNVADGFEGQIDDQRHRGRSGGWKVVGLPWTQS